MCARSRGKARRRAACVSVQSGESGQELKGGPGGGEVAETFISLPLAQIVIGGRDKYLINGHPAQQGSVARGAGVAALGAGVAQQLRCPRPAGRLR